ncbi:MAG: type I methionyl aminopeptidase [Candidatus Buchananbacteria bacterium RIFCSPLOWO2_01_FULL_46_12]|uniref:Methionine aminopeptidase n=2 Tax=Candidatus Buchananiibacteriota TaxID=1817903 RepID=A0A1G1YR50_9BACT|nr:MAG: type I methionyl aminopeptidase [Candidatus Buchananbacteria bacterium RIFCSPHIGHO2_01_FULL_44_11]OGY54832.1 MAG: type I methionyl aminopeptidase [Candidatus Buchananbacteria bacterium RIFCSPLOWO2_01_FULL_46_12]
MITIKKPEEIAVIAQGGKILAEVLSAVAKKAVPGVKTIELDQLAEQLIIQHGGIPSFKNYRSRHDDPAFPTTLCTSVNEQLVHVPASDYVLKKGDMLNIDIGMKYPAEGGFFTDMAITVPVGPISALAKKLIKVTRRSLELGIAQVKPGNFISDIARAIQTYVESQGFSVVRQLVGHGVGYQVHEEPMIPNYVDNRQKKVELQPGMVIAIEPMVSAGDYAIKTLEDQWSVVMADGSLGAHFEHTIVVTPDGHKVLTQF